jgi:hypothetical protein
MAMGKDEGMDRSRELWAWAKPGANAKNTIDARIKGYPARTIIRISSGYLELIYFYSG